MAMTNLYIPVSLQFGLTGKQISDIVRKLAKKKKWAFFENKLESCIEPGALCLSPTSVKEFSVRDEDKCRLNLEEKYEKVQLILICSERSSKKYFLKGGGEISKIVADFKELIEEIDSP